MKLKRMLEQIISKNLGSANDQEEPTEDAMDPNINESFTEFREFGSFAKVDQESQTEHPYDTAMQASDSVTDREGESFMEKSPKLGGAKRVTANYSNLKSFDNNAHTGIINL